MRYGHYFLSLTGVNIDRITQPDVSKGVNKLIYLGNSVNTAHSEYLKQIGGRQPLGGSPPILNT